VQRVMPTGWFLLLRFWVCSNTFFFGFHASLA
jgi:hypothetical protein